MFVGVDGCKKGWLVAFIDEDKNLSHDIITELGDLKKFSSSLILIDMPIGFPENSYRQCDIEARFLLGKGRSSSVFFTPHEKAAYANSHAEASLINKQYLGKGVSIQTWYICKKIKQLNEFIKENKHLQIKESHPELCFYLLNNHQAFVSNKNTQTGIADRKRVISSISRDYLSVIEKTTNNFKRKDVKLDDILDATVMAIRASTFDLKYLPTKSSKIDNHTIAY